jgi:hypothetical protein
MQEITKLQSLEIQKQILQCAIGELTLMHTQEGLQVMELGTSPQ